MSALSTRTATTVIPSLRYRDAPAAIDWLCDVSGFERHLVVPNPDGTTRIQLQQRQGNDVKATTMCRRWLE